MVRLSSWESAEQLVAAAFERRFDNSKPSFSHV